MRVWKKLIMVFIAYGIALMHTMVPHQHNAASSGQFVSIVELPSDSFGDFLEKIFSTDLGCGHLEKFQRSTDADLYFSLDVFPVYLSFDALLFATPERKSSRIAFGSYIEALHNRLLLLGSSHLRAPPSLV